MTDHTESNDAKMRELIARMKHLAEHQTPTCNASMTLFNDEAQVLLDALSAIPSAGSVPTEGSYDGEHWFDLSEAQNADPKFTRPAQPPSAGGGEPSPISVYEVHSLVDVPTYNVGRVHPIMVKLSDYEKAKAEIAELRAKLDAARFMDWGAMAASRDAALADAREGRELLKSALIWADEMDPGNARAAFLKSVDDFLAKGANNTNTETNQ